MTNVFTDTVIADAWKDILRDINSDIFEYNMVKPLPSVWTESNLILPDSTTVYPGPFRYDFTPYCKEIVDHFHPSSPVRNIAVMKGSQCGLTAGVVIPAICYIISQTPDPILFTAADKDMAGRTLAERLDPIMMHSNLQQLLRPNVTKKQNSRTGDTKFSKEFAGGTLTALGTNNADSFRFFHARYALCDDWETAPYNVGGSGSPDKVISGRQKSYGNKAKSGYFSTPKHTATSNILRQYLKGTQKKWHWPCPSCGTFVEVQWFKRGEDGTKYGMIYDLDANKKLIKSSIHFRTECCKHLIDYKDKYDLNLLGSWIASVDEPEEEFFESYQMNDIMIPPGFDDWEKIVREWLEANPPGRSAIPRLLVTFNNERLGLPFEEVGEAPKSNALMENEGEYAPGIVPDKSSEVDGNGQIVMLTLSCDLNGIMNSQEEDVRLDWEIVAHAASGSTYSVDHGSIGTFKRARDKKAFDKAIEEDRVKWTYMPGYTYSVWPALEEIIKKIYISENEKEFSLMVSVVDTGHFEKQAMQFITKMQEEGYSVFGIKGRTDENFRKIQRDSQPVKRSTENPRKLYIVEVNQLKDDLADSMKLRLGGDGQSQPAGFMNFPQPNDGKYTYPNYFIHYEGERRVEVKKSEEVIGFKWEKKHSQSQNHFWDVRVYNMAAPLVYLDLIRQSNPSKYRNYTWEDFVYDVTR